MTDEVEDVNASEPSTEEQVVEETVEETTEVESTQPETTGQPEKSQEESKPQYEPVDEFGVPYKNRAMEWQRKAQELTDRLPSMIEEAVAKAKQPTQERQYSISELESYAIQHPEYRPWVEEQKAKVIEENVGRVAEERVQAVEKKRDAEVKRGQAFQYVVQTYPEMFTRDNFGNVRFNNQNPLTQQVGEIMRDPRFSNDPDGLIAASDMAYGRLARMQNSTTQKKVKTLNQNLRKVQKQTMVEGSGIKTASEVKSGKQRAMDNLAKTGSIKDAKVAIGEILKLKKIETE